MQSTIRNVNIAAQDSPSIDAFGRWRVSNTGQRFDVEFTFDKQPALMDEIISGGATISHNATSRDVSLDINGTSGTASASFAQHWHNPYTPGNSQLIDITGTLDAGNIGTGTTSIFIKNGIDSSDTEIDQSNWSKNVVSDVDWTKSQIFQIDFQSLKVGRIRFNLVRDGLPVNVHEITNDNKVVGGYWQYPQQPVQWKIYNDGLGNTVTEMGYFNGTNGIGFRHKVATNATAECRAICATVKSEGGEGLFDISGFTRNADSGVAPITVSTTTIPILSIRQALTFNSLSNVGIAIPDSFSIQTDNPIKITVYYNATLTTPTWTSVNTRSTMEIDTTSTSLTGGIPIYSEYIGAGSKNTNTTAKGLLGRAVLAYGLDGVQDTLTIAAIKTTSTSADVLTAIHWREIR